MKLNNKIITLASYTSEQLEDDLIIFNEENKKIIIVNQTAAYIWNKILYAYNNNTDLTNDDILNDMSNEFLGMSNVCDVKSDIENTIKTFFEALLIY